MNMKPTALALAVAMAMGGLLSMVPVPAQAQMAVVDPISIANNLEAHIEDIAKYAAMIQNMESQLTQLQQQLHQAQQQYSSMTGSRGLGGILTENYNANIPTTWQGTLGQMQGGLVGQIANSVKQQASELQQPQFAHVDQGIKTSLDTNMSQAVNAQALNSQTYDDSAARFQRITDLMNQIDGTTDLKGIAELQARIQIENASLLNELIKVQSMNAMLVQQQNVQRQHDNQDTYKLYDAAY